MMRRSPGLHTVKKHRREGHTVRTYKRGKGGLRKRNSSRAHTERERLFIDSLARARTKEDIRNARYTDPRGRKKQDLETRMRGQWRRGHSGDTDMSFTHSKQEEYGPYNVFDPFTPEKDIISRDMPRKDLVFFYGPTQRKIYVGKGNKESRQTLKNEVKYQLDNYFTIEEVKEMGPLYVSVGGNSRGTAGTCTHTISALHTTHITGEKRVPHFVAIGKGFIQDKGVVTHEFIHAKRWGMKDWVKDRDREEKETELETMSRLSASSFGMMGTAGYYQHIPDVKRLLHTNYNEGLALMKKYQNEDRKLILGNKSRMKGRSLTMKINKHYNESHIARAKFSPAEKLDRFFLIETKQGKLNEHSRYIKPVTLEMIKSDYRKKYPDAKVWEIRDGSKVRIV